MRRRAGVPRILIPDTLHFGRRHFRPLHDLAAEGQIRLWTERSRRSWWRRGGDYRRLAGRLAPHLRELEAVPPAELPAHRHRGVPVLACARSELLRLLLRRWRGEVGPNRDPAMLERILACDRDREDLLLCMAAARDWIDFWLEALARKGPFSHAVVYSGGTIYARTLQEVGTRQGLRLFAVERFAVGNLYYFEERATPLPNRSLLADREWRRRLALPEEIGPREQVRAEAYRRLVSTLPRRAASETMTPPPFSRRDGGVVLVLGQAADDFRLIETPLPELSAQAVYRRLIGGILERTGLSVVFNGDPGLLDHWRRGLPAAWRARLRLSADEPLDALLSYAGWVVSLSSPALIWACRAGLKPAQIGWSFLGDKGFTHDLADAGGVVDALASGRLEGRLSLAEHRAFEEFLMRALVIHLIPNDRRGAAQAAARLAVRDHVPSLAEARPLPCPGPSRWRKAADALVNPAAALRLALDDRRRPDD